MFDKEGYLQDITQWSESIAQDIASKEGISLTHEHWEIILLLRDFYHEKSLSPPMRIFVKLIKEALGPTKGNSIYLHQLFLSSPAKMAAKIAGLPKPTNCL